MAGKIVTQLIIAGKNTAKKAFDEASAQLTNLTKLAKTAGAALAGAIATAAVTEYVRSSIDAVDITGELAERANMAAGEFAGLQYAAKFASIEGEALSATLSKFNANIVAAANGSKKQAAAFDQLGVGLRNQDGSLKGTNQLLLEVADKLAALPNGAQKSALAMDVFGKSGAKLLPLLNRGAAGIQALIDEAKDLGLVLDDKAYADAGQFNDTLDVLGASSEAAGQQVAVNLLPALNDVAGYLLTFSKDSQKAAESAGVLGTGLKLLTSAAIVIGSIFKRVGGVLGAVFAAAVQALQGNFEGAANTIKDGVSDISEGVGETKDDLTKLWNGEYGEQAMADRAQAAADQFDAAVSGMGESAGEAQQHADDLTDIQKQLLNDSKAYLAEQVKLESKANADLAAAKKAQLDTAKRYKDALAKVNAGPAGEASFSQANALKVAARDALSSNDLDGAKTKAQAALDVLEKIQEEGGNTYGFAGIIKELQAIEESADKIKLDKAEKSVEEAKASVQELKAEIAEVTNVKVSINLPDEEVNAIMEKFKKLGESIGQSLTVTPKINAPATAGGTSVPIQANAQGGPIRGPGTGTSDSILSWLSNGEFVVKAAAVQKYGVGMLSALNGMQLPRFAAGGLVGSAAAVGGGGGVGSLGTVILQFPDGTRHTLYGDQPTIEGLGARNEARKFGDRGVS